MPFSELNQERLLGQTVSLFFTFKHNAEDMFFRVFSVSPPPGFTLVLYTDSAPEFPGYVSDATGIAFDPAQNPLHPPTPLGRAHGNTGNSISALFLQDYIHKPYDVAAIQLDFVLPDTGFTIIGAELNLTSPSNSDIFGVGPGIRADIVPEAGSTAVLLAFALVLLLWQRSR